jgi:uncharacterized protein YebE (UPF0316 family)
LAVLSSNGYGATMIRASGALGEIDVIETVVERKNMKKVEKIFKEYDSDIFFVAEDVRAKRKGIFPKTESIFSRWRMGK